MREAPRGGPDGPRLLPKREFALTPAALLADNHSPASLRSLAEHRTALEVGKADLVVACSDSRLILPPAIIPIRSISAAVPYPLYSMLSRKQIPAERNVVVVHEPCGGLGVKGKQEIEGDARPGRNAGAYVTTHVASSDPYEQGIFAGDALTTMSKRPTLVTKQLHETGQLDVLALVTPTEGVIQHVVGSHEGLSRDAVPSEFVPFLTKYDAAVRQAKDADPDFAENQKVINPSVVLVTTQRYGNERFPETLGSHPNTTFTVTIPTPYAGMSEDSPAVPFDQTHYAFSHAVASQGDLSKPFGNLAQGGTLVIEASRDMELVFIADELSKREEIKQWRQDPSNQIILLRSEAGLVQEAHTYNDFFRNKFGIPL